MISETKKYFIEALSKDETQLNLAGAALLISQHLAQTDDLSTYLPLLDEMAANVRPAVEAAETATDKIEALNHYFFEQLNFKGNARSYYSANNSFLNKVLELKRGIPISLSVIYLEVGWRLALPVWGVGLPGHFIVGWGSEEPIYIDVFNRGRLLSEDDCLVLCHISKAHRATFREQFLRPATKREILFRMLLNLKQIYVRREDWTAAHMAVDLMLIVQPNQVNEFKDRGLLAYRLEQFHEAIFDLKRYLFLAPHSPDKDWLEERLELIEDQLSQLN